MSGENMDVTSIGQANVASNVIRKWSETAQVTEATFRADISIPRWRIRSRVLKMERVGS